MKIKKKSKDIKKKDSNLKLIQIAILMFIIYF